jgi:hypothetical protein
MDCLTPIHQSSPEVSGLKNKGLAYAHPSKLRFEKRKREKKYSSKLGYFFSLFLFIREHYRLVFETNNQLS